MGSNHGETASALLDARGGGRRREDASVPSFAGGQALGLDKAPGIVERRGPWIELHQLFNLFGDGLQLTTLKGREKFSFEAITVGDDVWF